MEAPFQTRDQFMINLEIKIIENNNAQGISVDQNFNQDSISSNNDDLNQTPASNIEPEANNNIMEPKSDTIGDISTNSSDINDLTNANIDEVSLTQSVNNLNTINQENKSNNEDSNWTLKQSDNIQLLESVKMVIPAAKEIVNVLIGDKTTDEISELSDAPSVYEDVENSELNNSSLLSSLTSDTNSMDELILPPPSEFLDNNNLEEDAFVDQDDNDGFQKKVEPDTKSRRHSVIEFLAAVALGPVLTVCSPEIEEDLMKSVVEEGNIVLDPHNLKNSILDTANAVEALELDENVENTCESKAQDNIENNNLTNKDVQTKEDVSEIKSMDTLVAADSKQPNAEQIAVNSSESNIIKAQEDNENKNILSKPESEEIKLESSNDSLICKEEESIIVLSEQTQAINDNASEPTTENAVEKITDNLTETTTENPAEAVILGDKSDVLVESEVVDSIIQNVEQSVELTTSNLKENEKIEQISVFSVEQTVTEAIVEESKINVPETVNGNEIKEETLASNLVVEIVEQTVTEAIVEESKINVPETVNANEIEKETLASNLVVEIVGEKPDVEIVPEAMSQVEQNVLSTSILDKSESNQIIDAKNVDIVINQTEIKSIVTTANEEIKETEKKEVAGTDSATNEVIENDVTSSTENTENQQIQNEIEETSKVKSSETLSATQIETECKETLQEIIQTDTVTEPDQTNIDSDISSTVKIEPEILNENLLTNNDAAAIESMNLKKDIEEVSTSEDTAVDAPIFKEKLQDITMSVNDSEQTKISSKNPNELETGKEVTDIQTSITQGEKNDHEQEIIADTSKATEEPKNLTNIIEKQPNNTESAANIETITDTNVTTISKITENISNDLENIILETFVTKAENKSEVIMESNVQKVEEPTKISNENTNVEEPLQDLNNVKQIAQNENIQVESIIVEPEEIVNSKTEKQDIDSTHQVVESISDETVNSDTIDTETTLKATETIKTSEAHINEVVEKLEITDSISTELKENVSSEIEISDINLTHDTPVTETVSKETASDQTSASELTSTEPSVSELASTEPSIEEISNLAEVTFTAEKIINEVVQKIESTESIVSDLKEDVNLETEKSVVDSTINSQFIETVTVETKLAESMSADVSSEGTEISSNSKTDLSEVEILTETLQTTIEEIKQIVVQNDSIQEEPEIQTKGVSEEATIISDPIVKTAAKEIPAEVQLEENERPNVATTDELQEKVPESEIDTKITDTKIAEIDQTSLEKETEEEIVPNVEAADQEPSQQSSDYSFDAQSLEISNESETYENESNDSAISIAKPIVPPKLKDSDNTKKRPTSLEFASPILQGSSSATKLVTPPSFKFLQPKRKLIEPCQILPQYSLDYTTAPSTPDKIVIEDDIKQSLPSVKALARAFLATSGKIHSKHPMAPPVKPRNNTTKDAPNMESNKPSVKSVKEDPDPAPALTPNIIKNNISFFENLK